MFSSSKISGISSKLASVAKLARTRTVLTAAVAVTSLGLGASSFGAISNITGFTSTMSSGPATTVSNVSGYGANNSYSPYKSSNTYTMHYLGNDQALTSVTAGGLGTYAVSGAGVVTTRTGSTGANNTTVWYQGTGSGADHTTVTLDGPQVTTYAQAFSSNNLLLGADNVFSNMGNAVGNNTNVDRIDILLTSGLKTSNNTAFSVLDRGLSNDHDAFGIAAITAEVGGVPTAYGPLHHFGDGTWGSTALVSNTTQEDITRKANAVNDGKGLHPSDSTAQSIGGVLIQTSSLGLPANTTIYGYSLFSGAVSQNDTSAELVNFAALPAADSTSTGGGLDPVGTLGNVYTLSAVPEPTTGALAALAIGGLVARRPKRKLA